MSVLLGATEIVARQFGEPDGSTHQLIYLSTKRGYSIAVNEDALFCLMRSEDGHPVLGCAHPIAVDIEAYRRSDDFRSAFVAGIVLISGKPTRNRVCAHIVLEGNRAALRDFIVEILQAQAPSVRRKDGYAFPISAGFLPGSDDSIIEIASHYIGQLVDGCFGADGIGFDLDAVEGKSMPSRLGLLAGILASVPPSGVLQFKSALVARGVHASLAETFGAIGSLDVGEWSPELFTARNNRTKLHTLTLEAAEIERLRRLVPLLSEVLPPTGSLPGDRFHADPIVSAKPVSGPAVAVDLKATGGAHSGGFNLVNVELDAASRERVREFVRSVGGVLS